MNQVLIPALEKSPARPRGAAVRSLTGASMGTTWSAQIAAADIDLSIVDAAIRRELDMVVAQMSPWEAGSILCRFNAAPAGAWLDMPPEFAEVLNRGLEIAHDTGGAFDPTLGALTDLWGFGPTPFNGAPPAEAKVANALAAGGWGRAIIDGGRIQQPGGLTLDLNGIAKGYAVDRAAKVLDEMGVTSYLVEIGGELRGAGLKPDGLPWWAELEAAPGAPANAPRTLVALIGLSIATSGGYRRFFDHEGRRFTHTLDPRDGRPLGDAIVSVSVLHDDCMSADALATALVVMGADQAQDFARDMDLPARIVVRDAGGVREILTPALAAMAD